VEDRLVFVIGAPRSGSTLLARMLGAHSAVLAPPEPHLLTPLAHLGYYARVDQAPYDPVISARAVRELVAQLPGGEADYLAALRAYGEAIGLAFQIADDVLDATATSAQLGKTAGRDAALAKSTFVSVLGVGAARAEAERLAAAAVDRLRQAALVSPTLVALAHYIVTRPN
jgi:hypothetical protein